MKEDEFVDRLCAFARTRLAPKCTKPMSLMAIGAATCGVGRRMLADRISPFVGMSADADGNIDVAGLRESVMGGIEMAGSVPILGGLLSVDASDAQAFFASL